MGVTRLEPLHESAKTPFRNDLLARDLLPNQLRYRQLQINLPVKRVEKFPGKQKYGTAGGASIRDSGDTHENETARKYDKTRINSNIVLPQGQDREKHAWPYSVDRCKISTLLAGAIRNIFVVRY